MLVGVPINVLMPATLEASTSESAAPACDASANDLDGDRRHQQHGRHVVQRAEATPVTIIGINISSQMRPRETR